MKFDVKDIKTWSNRHEVKVGDEGYFCNYISQLQNNKYLLLTTIDRVDDETGFCFVPKGYCDGFDFFLPADAVKEDKPKKKYRSFKDLFEFYKCISEKYDDVEHDEIQVMKKLCNKKLVVRMKGNEKSVSCMLITSCNHNADIESYSVCLGSWTTDFENLFQNYEFNVGDQWKPFRIEDTEE